MIKQIVVNGMDLGMGKIKRGIFKMIFGYALTFLGIFFFLLAIAEFISSKITFFTKAELYLSMAIALVLLSFLLKSFRR